MFCALCRTEYRENPGNCSGCGGPLVAQDAVFPTRAVWRIDHRETSRAVLEALRAAGIACHHRARNDHWIYALLLRRPEFEVWILKEDAARAHDVLVRMERPPEFQEEAPEVTEQAVQQCPFCHAENPEGYAACATCGIDLSTWQQQPFVPTEGDSPVLLWKGSDTIALSRIVDRLQSESMPFNFLPTSEHLAFELGVARPRWEIRVYRSDAEKAFGLIADIHESFPFVDTRDDLDAVELTAGPAVPLKPAPPSVLGPVFNPAAATAEGWTGTDPGLAQALRLAWRENAIESWTVEDADGTQHLWIEGIQQEQAAQILREVTGASVPFES